jgi:pyrrolidone-carboxylate peptidase
MSLQTAARMQTVAKPAITPAVGGILPRACACGQHTGNGGACEECKKKRQGTLQRSPTNATPGGEVPPIVHKVLGSLGQPLDKATRDFMEPRFRRDFSNVRVHTDVQAAESARAVDALAYTVGSDVVFGAGEYQPTTQAGRRLMAHELTHVVQQQMTLGSSFDLSIAPSNSPYEDPATAAATLIGRAQTAQPTLNRLTLQRQPANAPTTSPSCSTAHPESCTMFEDWLGTFAALPSFQGSFTDPQGRQRDLKQVIGERAPTVVPNPAPASLQGNTRGIERPWAGWLRANLPPALVETAYELPTDCADIVLILRHVWLAAHGRTERVGSWTLGQGVTTRRIGEITEAVTTRTFKQGMIAFYRDVNGAPLRSFNQLLPLLHPGDVLIWEHRDARGERAGGHSETIETISFNPTVITTLQGNQPLSDREGDSLGGWRGWRIERGGLDPGDLRDLHGVWTWTDGTTVLIGAGPWGGTPLASQRPPRPTHGAARVLRDWRPALNRARIADLPGVLEGALGEARAALEGQRTVPLSEARQVGEQIGARLWRLAHQAGDLGVSSHFEPLEQLLQILDAYRTHTRVTGSSTQGVIDGVYHEIREALELAARGASTINFNRAPTGRGARSVNILLTGFDPFAGEGVRPGREQWNTSGAAAMALDGERIPAGGNVFALVESVVLPVDYNRFALGMVENIARPLLPTLDAVVTVSMDSTLSGRAAIERYATNFHRVEHPQPGSGSTPAVQTGPIPLPPVTGGPSTVPGPPILRAWQAVDQLTGPTQTGEMGAFVRSDLTLRFSSPSLAQAAVQDMGLSATQFNQAGRDVEFLDPTVIQRLLGVPQPPSGQPANRLHWPAFRNPNASFDADVVNGPGGSFLSNEVSYRMLRLIRQQTSGAASFHVHTPNAPDVPVADRANRRSPLLQAAMGVRSSVIAGLRRILAQVARILRP